MATTSEENSHNGSLATATIVAIAFGIICVLAAMIILGWLMLFVRNRRNEPHFEPVSPKDSRTFATSMAHSPASDRALISGPPTPVDPPSTFSMVDRRTRASIPPYLNLSASDEGGGRVRSAILSPTVIDLDVLSPTSPRLNRTLESVSEKEKATMAASVMVSNVDGESVAFEPMPTGHMRIKPMKATSMPRIVEDEDEPGAQVMTKSCFSDGAQSDRETE